MLPGRDRPLNAKKAPHTREVYAQQGRAGPAGNRRPDPKTHAPERRKRLPRHPNTPQETLMKLTCYVESYGERGGFLGSPASQTLFRETALGQSTAMETQVGR